MMVAVTVLLFIQSFVGIFVKKRESEREQKKTLETTPEFTEV